MLGGGLAGGIGRAIGGGNFTEGLGTGAAIGGGTGLLSGALTGSAMPALMTGTGGHKRMLAANLLGIGGNIGAGVHQYRAARAAQQNQR